MMSAVCTQRSVNHLSPYEYVLILLSNQNITEIASAEDAVLSKIVDIFQCVHHPSSLTITYRLPSPLPSSLSINILPLHHLPPSPLPSSLSINILPLHHLPPSPSISSLSIIFLPLHQYPPSPSPSSLSINILPLHHLPPSPSPSSLSINISLFSPYPTIFSLCTLSSLIFSHYGCFLTSSTIVCVCICVCGCVCVCVCVCVCAVLWRSFFSGHQLLMALRS